MIEFRDVHKSFGNLEVLKGINLNIEKGQVVTLIGPSGSGKSTILRCINLLEKPTKGQVFIDGTDIRFQRLISRLSERISAWCSSILTCFPI